MGDGGDRERSTLEARAINHWLAPWIDNLLIDKGHGAPSSRGPVPRGFIKDAFTGLMDGECALAGRRLGVLGCVSMKRLQVMSRKGLLLE